MGTHPIFESDFDSNRFDFGRKSMAYAAGAKILKDAGETVSDVETQLSQALVEVETNAQSDLKEPLRQLYFKSAKEFDVGSGRKAIAIIVPQPQIKAWQKKSSRKLSENSRKNSLANTSSSSPSDESFLNLPERPVTRSKSDHSAELSLLFTTEFWRIFATQPRSSESALESVLMLPVF